MICENEYIHIIELKDAQNNILTNVRLKDEIDIVKGVFAVAYVPVEGAVNMNGFKEEEQLKSGLLSLEFSNCDTTYSVPVLFECVQGFIPNEESNYNGNKQVLYKPLPLFKKVEPNTSMRIKYRDSVSGFRVKHNLKIFLTYIDK